MSAHPLARPAVAGGRPPKPEPVFSRGATTARPGRRIATLARRRARVVVLAFAAAAECVTAGVARASPIVAGVNPDATPAFANNTYVRWGSTDAGWYYTPSASFDLDGVYTRFLALGDTSGPASTVKTLTVQVRTDRPASGGTVLRQGAFDVTLGTGGYAGATFAPVRLTAGTRYFVDLLNVQDVGINLATWDADASGNPRPAGGATVNLGTFYRNFGTDADFAAEGPAYGQSAGLNVAGGEPILYFAGTALPEPSALALAGTPLLSLLAGRRRRR